MAGLSLTPVSLVQAYGMRFARVAIRQCVNQTSLAKVSVT